MSDDPEDLIRRATQREVEAFATLYEQHVDSVFRFALYKVGETPLAEDLTADVFARAWESIDRFQWRNTPFQHWLMRIARNVVVDHWRANRRPIGTIDDLFDAASNEAPPDEVVARSLEAEKVRAALLQLPDDQREVLILRFIEGFSHAEVAAVLNKSVVGVRQIQVRGLARLKGLLGSPEDFGRPAE